jgi:preprotein translocase subunit SecA
VEEGEAIENRLLSRVIENAQKKVEARNFDIRKHLLDYDDVMNKQRQAFYSRRRDVMSREEVHEEIVDMAEGTIVSLLDTHWPEKSELDPQLLGELATAFEAQFGATFDLRQPPFLVEGALPGDRDVFGRGVLDRVTAAIGAKRQRCDGLAADHPGYPRFVDFERDILLRILDTQWKDHLHTMDGLREGIGLRGYASRDPKIEYQREGYALFEEMNDRIDVHSLELAFKFALPEPVVEPAPRPAQVPPGAEGPGPGMQRRRGPPARSGKSGKVGRNEPCPCGSGKKYKKCCGAN